MIHNITWTSSEFASGAAKSIPAVPGKIIKLLGICFASGQTTQATTSTTRAMQAQYAATESDLSNRATVVTPNFAAGTPVASVDRTVLSSTLIRATNADSDILNMEGLPLFFNWVSGTNILDGDITMSFIYTLV